MVLSCLDGRDMDSETILGWLVGVDRDVSRQFLLFGFAVLALAVLIEAFVGASLGLFGFSGAERTGWWLMVLLASVAVLAAAANGYGNDGVLVGALVALAPLLGVLLFVILVRFGDIPGIASTDGEFVGLTTAAGILGVVATIAGATGGRLVRGERSTPFSRKRRWR